MERLKDGREREQVPKHLLSWTWTAAPLRSCKDGCEGRCLLLLLLHTCTLSNPADNARPALKQPMPSFYISIILIPINIKRRPARLREALAYQNGWIFHGATPNLHFSHLHDSILHAQPYTPQVYTIPNLHDPQIYTTHIYTLKFTQHQIYTKFTQPLIYINQIYTPKSTQNKHSNLLWFDHQNIARVQKLSLPFSVSIGISSVFYRYFIGIIISIRTINSICSICSINSINSICSIWYNFVRPLKGGYRKFWPPLAWP